MVNTKINLLGIEIDNPIIPASGTYGFGYEFAELYDINILGTFSFKGTTKEPRFGNPTPRIAEVYGGMLNAIGLQNPGIDVFCERDIPFLKQYDTKIIVEEVVQNLKEVNIAVMGNYEHQKVSVIEEVLSSNKFLTYTDKYIGGGKGKLKGGVKAPVKGSKGMASTSRIVPARLSKEMTEEVCETYTITDN